MIFKTFTNGHDKLIIWPNLLHNRICLPFPPKMREILFTDTPIGSAVIKIIQQTLLEQFELKLLFFLKLQFENLLKK